MISLVTFCIPLLNPLSFFYHLKTTTSKSWHTSCIPFFCKPGIILVYRHRSFSDIFLSFGSVRPSTSFSADTDMPIFLPLTDTDMLKSGRDTAWLKDEKCHTPPHLMTAAANRLQREWMPLICRQQSNTFILGLIIAPNNHTTPTDTYYWARTREWWRQPCVRLYYTCSLQCLMCAAFWNSDYRPTGNGVKSSDGLVLFENCKNITGFFTHRCQRCASLHCT